MRREKNVIKIPVYMIVTIVILVGIVITYICGKQIIANSAKYKVTNASTTEDGKFEYEILDGGTIEITKYAGEETELTIPETIDGKIVTSIGNYAIINDIITVKIPATITNIGQDVFNTNEDLKEINVAEDNEKYMSENGILFNKEKTELICYPSGKREAKYVIPEGVTTIGDGAFSYCYAIANVEIPSTVDKIGYSVFIKCKKLTAIDVSLNNKNYTSLNGVLFNKEQTEIICYPAGKQETSYIIPNGVIEIEDYAFHYCEKILNIEISESVTYIGKGAFGYCTNLINVNIPDGITVIENEAFCQCHSLKDIEMPNSINKIGWAAFFNCESFTNVRIPDNVKIISWGAFSGCNNLSNLEIPYTAINIADGAFYESQINKNVQNATEIEVLDIIKRAMDSNDVLYSELGIEFKNCSLNDDSTKLLLNISDKNSNEISIVMNSGPLKGLKVLFIKTASLEITSEMYDIKDEYISSVKPETTITVFNENIAKNTTEINVYNNQGIVANNESVATGMKVEFKLGTETKTYEIVVNGDLTGDGKMDDIDLLRMARYIAGLDRNLNGAYLRAAEIHKDNNIADESDLLKMVRVLADLDTF